MCKQIFLLWSKDRGRDTHCCYNFNKEEKVMLVTSLYFSKLYYGSEEWHLPSRTEAQNKQLKFASANALRICDKFTIFNTHTEIHQATKRAMPDQYMNYKHALLMYNLFRKCSPDEEFVQLNFQANLNTRMKHQNFIKTPKPQNPKTPSGYEECMSS